nr:hypothetical protein CFP56_20630 [Quercus suber]
MLIYVGSETARACLLDHRVFIANMGGRDLADKAEVLEGGVRSSKGTLVLVSYVQACLYLAVLPTTVNTSTACLSFSLLPSTVEAQSHLAVRSLLRPSSNHSFVYCNSMATRELLKKQITLSQARKSERNILHELVLPEQEAAFLERLKEKRHPLEASVALHLGISIATCWMHPPTNWFHGS